MSLHDLVVPTPEDLLSALEENATRIGSRWLFRRDLDSTHTVDEATARSLAKICLMLGVTPSPIITTELMESVVDHLADMDSRLRALERATDVQG